MSETDEWNAAVSDRKSLIRAIHLVGACKLALDHVSELRDAWQRGAITEHDGKGGTRSNRNVEVETALRKALESTEGGD